MRLSKKLLSVVLCLIMVFGTVAVGGESLVKAMEFLTVKASASTVPSNVKIKLLTDNRAVGATVELEVTGNNIEHGFWQVKSDEYVYTTVNEYGYEIEESETDIINGADLPYNNESRHFSFTINYPVNYVAYYCAYNENGNVKSNEITVCGTNNYYIVKYEEPVSGYVPISDLDIDLLFGEPVSYGASLTISKTYIPYVSYYYPELRDYEYTFMGWSLNENASYPDYLPGDYICVNDNLVLHPVFSKVFIQTFLNEDGTVSFLANSEMKGFYHIPSMIENRIVTTMVNCCFWGSKLKGITIPNSITKISESAFRNCIELTSITIPKNILSIGNLAFAGCCGLTSITIPENVKEIGSWSFEGCSSLSSISLPDGIIIGASAFKDCNNISNIVIPDNSIIEDYAFYNCINLTNITIPDSVLTIGADAFNNTGYYNNNDNWENEALYIGNHLIDTKRTLSSYTVKQGTKCIASEAFDSCILTEINIPEGVTSLGDSPFLNCYRLTSIEIPSSVMNIGHYLFWGCDDLVSVTVAEGNPKYHSINNCVIETATKTLIAGCGASIIPNDGSVIIIGDESFGNIKGLIELNIPSCITSIGEYAFLGCDGLKSIIIPDSVDVIGEGAFQQCRNIESITVSQGNKNYKSSGNCLVDISNKTLIKGCQNSSIPNDRSVTIIKDCAFEDCVGLKEIVIPNGISEIGLFAFENCSELGTLSIPESVTRIASYAFSGCSNIKSITIPKELTSIGYGVFDKCYSLTDVYYAGNINDKNKIWIGDENNDRFINATWHYNVTSVDDHYGNVWISDNNSHWQVCSCGNKGNIAIHSFNNGIVAKKPSPFENGEKVYTCTICGYKKTETIPKKSINDLPETNIIKGNAADNQKTYNYKTSVTFTANVPEGGSVQWYVDGKPMGNAETLTVKDRTSSYKVTALVTDKDGNQTIDEENVTIKNGFFDKIIWFFIHLFNPGAYDIKQ